MIKFAMIPFAVLSAAGAQILMKHAINMTVEDGLSLVSVLKTWHIYASVASYLCAFITSLYLFSVFELSFISPVLVGGVMLLVFITGAYWGEAVTTIRMAGGFFLIAGTALLAYSN